MIQNLFRRTLRAGSCGKVPSSVFPVPLVAAEPLKPRQVCPQMDLLKAVPKCRVCEGRMQEVSGSELSISTFDVPCVDCKKLVNANTTTFEADARNSLCCSIL
jgi:hypothetical protein